MSYDNQDDNVVPFNADGSPRTGRTPDHIQGTSDDTLAVSFADNFNDKLRYVGQWNKWMTWTGNKWEFDYMLVAYRQAREYIRKVAKGISDKLFKARVEEIPPNASTQTVKVKRADARAESRRAVKYLLSSRTIHSVASLARSDNRIALPIDAWDKDPYLLNTPGGTVDLRTGNVRKHNPFDYITRITAASPASDKPTQWLEFLKTIMHGDDAMILYLQKVFGYCLVGDVKEHEMYFAYGTGGNGKGVTLNTMRNILGDYGVEANIETFIITASQGHPTELASLRGARLVTCGETDEGQRWAEARIKKMTGGDPVRARFMRQDEFEYSPQFKLFLAGNHKPKLSNVDEAIKRRFRLIPFTYNIPKNKIDLDLGQKLRAEWPNILHWALEGCLMWQREGLLPPASVSEATQSYLNQEDAASAWWDECCIAEPDAFTTAQALYDSWVKWAQANGEPYGTKLKLTRLLEDREPVLGIRKTRRGEGNGFVGVELNRPPKKGE